VSTPPYDPQTLAHAVAVDRTSPVPLYFQVATRMQQLIEGGEIPVGARLENEIDLADQLGVSRPTMRRAIQYLVERGMLVRKRGVGTQVVHPKLHRPVELTSLYDDLAKAGRTPRTTVVSFDVLPATDAIAQALGVPEGTKVTSVTRLRFADQEPLALMYNAVPVDVIRLDAEDLEARGLYELLRNAGYIPRMATQTIGARGASAAEARQLGEKRGASVLTMTRTAWDANGRPLEYGSHIYPASRYSFEFRMASV
jgi:DNA-binding GntR family transcriptional regulator